MILKVSAYSRVQAVADHIKTWMGQNSRKVDMEKLRSAIKAPQELFEKAIFKLESEGAVVTAQVVYLVKDPEDAEDDDMFDGHAEEFNSEKEESDAPNIKTFAGQILSLAPKMQAYKVFPSSNKYFISDVYKVYSQNKKMSIQEFKKLLVDAFDADLLTLSKPDMPQVLDPSKLKESTIVDGGYGYTFVTL